MQRQEHREGAAVQHNAFEFLNWPVLGLNITVLGWNWDTFWAHMPGPTAIYAFLSALFMLFQMADRLGLLPRRGKRDREEH